MTGIPDLLVGYRGYNFLLEVKQQGKTLRESQETFRDSWDGQSAVVYTPEDACRLVMTHACEDETRPSAAIES